jgi:Zn-dependent alcohol dehydrogenase
MMWLILPSITVCVLTAIGLAVVIAVQWSASALILAIDGRRENGRWERKSVAIETTSDSRYA